MKKPLVLAFMASVVFSGVGASKTQVRVTGNVVAAVALGDVHINERKDTAQYDTNVWLQPLGAYHAMSIYHSNGSNWAIEVERSDRGMIMHFY